MLKRKKYDKKGEKKKEKYIYMIKKGVFSSSRPLLPLKAHGPYTLVICVTQPYDSPELDHT